MLCSQKAACHCTCPAHSPSAFSHTWNLSINTEQGTPVTLLLQFPFTSKAVKQPAVLSDPAISPAPAHNQVRAGEAQRQTPPFCLRIWSKAFPGAWLIAQYFFPAKCLQTILILTRTGSTWGEVSPFLKAFAAHTQQYRDERGHKAEQQVTLAHGTSSCVARSPKHSEFLLC